MPVISHMQVTIDMGRARRLLNMDNLATRHDKSAG